MNFCNRHYRISFLPFLSKAYYNRDSRLLVFPYTFLQIKSHFKHFYLPYVKKIVVEFPFISKYFYLHRYV